MGDGIEIERPRLDLADQPGRRPYKQPRANRLPGSQIRPDRCQRGTGQRGQAAGDMGNAIKLRELMRSASAF